MNVSRFLSHRPLLSVSETVPQSVPNLSRAECGPVTQSVTPLSHRQPECDVTDTPPLKGCHVTPTSPSLRLSFDPETMVRCRDYRSHQTSHRRAGSGSDLRRLLRGDAVTTSPRSVHAVVFGRLYSRFVRQGGPWGYPHKAKRFANVRAFRSCVHGRVSLFFV